MRISYSSSSGILLIFILIVTFPCGLSLHVVPGSNCTALCSYQNLISNTTSDEITCQDKGYEDTVVGKTFKDCVTCEFESKSFDQGTGQTDVGWGLYNMRYTLDWCLFGAAASRNETSMTATCDAACQPTNRSLDVNSENSTSPNPYGYCEGLDSIAFTNCAVCYAQVSDHDYLSNFLRLLSSACEWKIIPPMGFPIKGSQVFTHHAPSNYSTIGPNSSPHHSSGGLSDQSKLAIGIAIPIILFLILCSLLLFWYYKIHLPGKSLHSPFEEEEPEFQLYERRGGSEKGTSSLPPDSPWHDTPTIYHPTPALQQHTRYAPPPLLPPPTTTTLPAAAHLRLHQPPRLSRQRQQQQQQQQQHHQGAAPPSRPTIKLETGAIMAAAPSVRSSSPPPHHHPPRRLSTRTFSPPPLSSTPFATEANTLEKNVGGQWGQAEQGGQGGKTKRKFRIPFARMQDKTGTMMMKKGKKRTGGKDATGSEDLFS